MDKTRYRAIFSWLSLGLLVILVGILGALQYRWTGEISEAEQKKLQENLQATLGEVARDFNAEIRRATFALSPSVEEIKELGRERAYASRYQQWSSAAHYPKIFERIGIAWAANGKLNLRILDPATTTFEDADWPSTWEPVRNRIVGRIEGGPPGNFDRANADSPVFEIPRFGGPRGERRSEQEWILVQPDLTYAENTVLPELLARHFGPDYANQYAASLNAKSAEDASVAILDVGPGRGPGPGNGPGPGTENGAFRGPRGRWRLSIHLKSGSLESVVARARWRNVGISAAIFLLLVATGAALLRLSWQAQRLAETEMEFVAGVSHELRTPLTVIRTAAFNLRGRLSNDPYQVERYGRLIQNESEKLTGIVEQVLRFASAKRGRVIREREPVLIESLIEDALQSSREVLEESLCQVDIHLEPALPPVLGDSVALRHAFQNLISNAVKYGMEGDRWIGVFARTIPVSGGSQVEIRFEDHGPGIPEEEQRHVFEAFYRGKKAVRDQVHGTGLGLSLVKRIVEAHGGAVEVESEPGAGASFIMRIPTWRSEDQDELAHSLG